MRLNFHLFGDMVFLNSMKHKQNSVKWPYIGPVIVDEDDRIGVIAESITSSERIEAYVWIMEQVLQWTPTRQHESINMIYGDGILSLSLLERLHISNSCNFSYDIHHLLGPSKRLG